MSGGKAPISFSLSKSKRGFVKPANVNIEGKDGDSNDEGLALKKAIVIPLKEGNEIGQRKQETTPIIEAPYNPKGYGLQLRKKPSASTVLPPTPYSTRSHDEPSYPQTVKRTDEEKLDDDLRVLPEDPSSKAYREVPVEEFGLAMLRGMGWDESKAKRQAQEKAVTPPKQRPPMLGLGAKPGDPNLIKRPDYISQRTKKHPDKDKEEHIIAVGSHVKVVKGEHSHMLGTVTKVSKGAATLKLRSSGEHVVVDVEHVVSESLAATLMPLSLEETLLEHIKGVYPGIRVQVISKTFNNGALYMKNGRVIDVHLESDWLCSIQFSDGSVVHSVPHTVLKSVIPPVGADVMILTGTHAGHRASLLRLDSMNSTGVLQLSEDESVILTLSYLDFSSV